MTHEIAVLVLIAGSVVASAQGPSPRKQLKLLVEQLQSAPEDDELRKKIIGIVRELKPKPAIPEDARKAFFEGAGIVTAAKDPKQVTLAVTSFEEALKLAPWWDEAYINLAIAQELSGQYDAAEKSLRLYLFTGPSEKDARNAQDRIYALSGKKKAVQAARLKSVEGYWQFVGDSEHQEPARKKEFREFELRSVLYRHIYREGESIHICYDVHCPPTSTGPLEKGNNLEFGASMSESQISWSRALILIEEGTYGFRETCRLLDQNRLRCDLIDYGAPPDGSDREPDRWQDWERRESCVGTGEDRKHLRSCR